MKFLPACGLLLAMLGCAHAQWTQDGGNAQRTGFTAEEPALPWKFAWAWNGPDAQGGPGGHKYHQPTPHEPWEARTISGGAHIYAPAGKQGIYALRKSDGSVAWQFTEGSCNAAPAFLDGSLIVGTDEGTLFHLDAGSGRIAGKYAAGSPLTKAALVADGHAFALCKDGVLHKVSIAKMVAAWTYRAGSDAQTSAAYSAAQGTVLFCTADLNVHCVNAADGTRRWVSKPSPLVPGPDVEFTGGWPVIAEKRGVVFVRMLTGSIDSVLWSGGGKGGKWPDKCEAIRERLTANPRLKNLFALRLDDGSQAFVPAVGPAGVEDMRDGKPRLRVPAMPVVKTIGDREFAYVHWRNGDTKDPKWDGRWDSHLGEMTLADADGLKAGDVRFVQFTGHGGWAHITDESCSLSMAGDTLFYAHWDISQSARITDRSSSLGQTRASAIKTESRPSVVRHAKLGEPDAATHFSAKAMNLMDGRYQSGPAFWTYANVLDPPTPTRNAYSEGILPRYTYVSDGLIVVQGNGGELLVLRAK